MGKTKNRLTATKPKNGCVRSGPAYPRPGQIDLPWTTLARPWVLVVGGRYGGLQEGRQGLATLDLPWTCYPGPTLDLPWTCYPGPGCLTQARAWQVLDLDPHPATLYLVDCRERLPYTWLTVGGVYPIPSLLWEACG